MKFIKKHTIESIALIVFLILLFVGGGLFLSMWNQGSGSKYGTRLHGINKVKISNKDLKNVEKKISGNENVVKVSSNIEGRIINFVVTVNAGTDPESVKGLGDIILNDNFSKSELAFYDLQLYLVEKDAKEGSQYPKIGYKSKTGEKFVWSNN